MMCPGNIILAVNLQFKGFNQISSVPKLYNSELSSFTTIPKNKHFINIFNDYKIFLQKSEVSVELKLLNVIIICI